MPYLVLSSRPSRIYTRATNLAYDTRSRQHDMESPYHHHALDCRLYFVYSILFYSILFYSILFYSILFYFYRVLEQSKVAYHGSPFFSTLCLPFQLSIFSNVGPVMKTVLVFTVVFTTLVLDFSHFPF